MGTPPKSPVFVTDTHDLYGLFHGFDYAGALADFTTVVGKTILPPRSTAGVWRSRWFDEANSDVLSIVDDFSSRGFPLDVFVLDMNFHAKNDWSGFTFDANLFPFPADTMGSLAALGLPVLVNIHDADGVGVWEAQFPALAAALGVSTSTAVPFNLVNKTVAYAVEDIVLGDLLAKGVSAFWIDWQQGGSAGGMTGGKQNPTIWLAHLRCTDRHRNGDPRRAFVLARWGGMGHSRYQVGFSGDVRELSWDTLRYQPYFSATAQNVLFPFWSHDLVGPPDDLELYARWLQVGAMSGIMRTHDRGLSGGDCANTQPVSPSEWGADTGSCDMVEPWNVGPSFFGANRRAFTWRAQLLPYIYSTMRSAFDTGLGLTIPCYYMHPQEPLAYAMTGDGQGVQYYFGGDILVSPVVAPANPTVKADLFSLAWKLTWLPDGSWYNAVSGAVTVASGGETFVNKTYSISEMPVWYKSGAVLPMLPLRSLPSLVGNAAQQYTFLSWVLVPGAATGSGRVYEDDGATTAYLTDNAFVFTTCSFVSQGDTTTLTVSSQGAGFPEFPRSRALQFRFLNGAPVLSVTANGVAVPYARHGKVASRNRAPTASVHYYDFAPGEWLGPVIELANVDTASPLTVVVTFAPQQPSLSGVLGAVSRALQAKHVTDLERRTPGSETVQPASTSVLSSLGEGLAFLAGTDPTGFASSVARVPGLLAAGATELARCGAAHAPTAVALLQGAMV